MSRDDFTKYPIDGGLQGDVGLHRISALPESAKPLEGNIVAKGEKTGHQHILDIPGVRLYEAPAADLNPNEVDVKSLQRTLRTFPADEQVVVLAEILEDAPLRHQEHGTQFYKPGFYWVVRQFEFPLGEPKTQQPVEPKPRRVTD